MREPHAILPSRYFRLPLWGSHAPRGASAPARVATPTAKILNSEYIGPGISVASNPHRSAGPRSRTDARKGGGSCSGRLPSFCWCCGRSACSRRTRPAGCSISCSSSRSLWWCSSSLVAADLSDGEPGQRSSSWDDAHSERQAKGGRGMKALRGFGFAVLTIALASAWGAGRRRPKKERGSTSMTP